jgi:hypothetical protein
MYSRLDLTRDYDRATAIASLQQRLIKVMGLQGDYGVFDSSENPGLLRRSLLWHRPLEHKTLSRIDYPLKQEVPSWSWMAYSGAIDYFPLTFYGFEWQPLDASWPGSANAAQDANLIAQVQTLNISAAKPFEALLVYDIPAEVNDKEMMAVSIGLEKGETSLEDRKHYILVVIPKRLYWKQALYERVGAGYVPGRCLIGDRKDCILI